MRIGVDYFDYISGYILKDLFLDLYIFKAFQCFYKAFWATFL